MKTTISNMLYVEDPSLILKTYVKDRLELPNPDYVKKERMGFWTGRTPKVLRLYEWNGNTLVLPFGLIRELMPILSAGEVQSYFTGGTDVDYGAPVPLYDYQREAVAHMITAKYGILKSKAGSGKTMMGIALIKALGKKALWLCHTADLLHQSRERAERYADSNLMGTITEGKVNIGTGITFATVQTMCNVDLDRYRDEWDVIVVDECFPPDTIISTVDGEKKISQVMPGDLVLAINETGSLTYSRVNETMKRKPYSLVEVRLANGMSIVCTKNHPIKTKRGYVSAEDLSTADAVCCLRTDGRYNELSRWNEEQDGLRQTKGFVFSRMPGKRFSEKVKARRRLSGKLQQKVCIRTDEAEQSCQKTGNAETDIREFKKDWTPPICSRRQWNREYCTTESPAECDPAEKRSIRICYSNKSKTRKWLSNVLQSGHRSSKCKTCHRSRRLFTLLSESSGKRQEENMFLEWIRVDSVEIQKPTGDGTYGGVCVGGFVYNLSVEANHNYFANGMNVHNCHRVSQSATTVSRYQRVLNNLAARHKYGLTATPERSDGLIEATFALIGRVVYEVPDEAVADKVMRVTIRPVITDTEITDDCLNVDGTINYTKLIEHLTTDEQRNRLIVSMIAREKGHSCIILSDRIAQLEAIMNMLPDDMKGKAAFINGKMQSKKAKAERENLIEQMRTGEKRYLFASVSLCKEGLDIPRLDRLFFSSPVKFSSVVIQSVGRIQRTFPGKGTPIVYDFVDNRIGFCERAFRERKRSYRKVGAEIEVPLDEPYQASQYMAFDESQVQQTE